MNLKLDQIPKRSLNIEKPDGSFVTLSLKRFALKDVPDLERQSDEFNMQRIKGEIDVREYYNQILSLVIDEFEIGCFDDLEVEHLQVISDKINELRKTKETVEKKSRG